MIRTIGVCVAAACTVLLLGGCRFAMDADGSRGVITSRRSRCAAGAYYVRGLARERAGDIGGAKADWLTGIGSRGCDSARAHAMLALGDLCYQAGDAAGAARRYRQCITLVGPRGKPSLQAYFRLGSVLQREGRWAEATAAFGRLVRLFSRTRLASVVRDRMNGSAWTVQAGAFAEKSNADALVRRLARRKLTAVEKARPRSAGGAYYIVMVGRYRTYSLAAAALRDVRHTQDNAFISVTR